MQPYKNKLERLHLASARTILASLQHFSYATINLTFTFDLDSVRVIQLCLYLGHRSSICPDVYKHMLKWSVNTGDCAQMNSTATVATHSPTEL